MREDGTDRLATLMRLWDGRTYLVGAGGADIIRLGATSTRVADRWRGRQTWSAAPGLSP